MKLYTIRDSHGPKVRHRSRAAAALDVLDRLDGTGPRSLTGAEIVKALTRSSQLWVQCTNGREVSVDWTEVAR